MAGLGAGLTPRGSGVAPLMWKNQSRMNRHKGSSGVGVGGDKRKDKKDGGGGGGRRGRRRRYEE